MGLTKEQKKVYQREYMRKRRSNIGGSNKDVTLETVPACHVRGITGKFKSLPERPRYLTLSDGQVLDRSIIVPGHASGDFMQRMRYCNESAYNYHPNKSNKELVRAIIKESK